MLFVATFWINLYEFSTTKGQDVVTSTSIVDKHMRHKAQGVGATFYSHISAFEMREAVEKLPAYPWPADLLAQAQKKVG